MRILLDLARSSIEISSLDQFLDQAAVHVARAVEVHHTKIMRYRREHADLLLIAGRGWKKGVVGAATFPTDLRSPPGRAFRTAEPVILHDLGDAPDFVISPTLKEHDIVSLANVPILVDGAAWGVLEADSTSLRDFSSDTMQFMMTAATIVGSSIKHRAESSGETATIAAELARAQTRGVLLREMQHRVKNNFQLILSAISIQQRRHPIPDVARALNHVASRINAMSLAHDQLATREDSQVVDVANYLRLLCMSIQQQTDNIAIELDADDIELTIERAVSLGLIVNELIANSIKHAFDENGGRVEVKLTSGVGYGDARLIVSDNGRGIQNPRPTDSRGGGSGLKLVEALARHVGGLLDQESSSSGTATSVVFPIVG
ncbi:sensor histidine kinase [Roseiterribacter gracilis]|uniref:histidine kinase n=1 Tax=Roseiterribacter gracilis TaxID=2812848 RepID=A0A8S8XBA7_9PROT|nr:histidine kinase [Rhodospirillales bacterium TMPK1]